MSSDDDFDFLVEDNPRDANESKAAVEIVHLKDDLRAKSGEVNLLRDQLRNIARQHDQEISSLMENHANYREGMNQELARVKGEKSVVEFQLASKEEELRRRGLLTRSHPLGMPSAGSNLRNDTSASQSGSINGQEYSGPVTRTSSSVAGIGGDGFIVKKRQKISSSFHEYAISSHVPLPHNPPNGNSGQVPMVSPDLKLFDFQTIAASENFQKLYSFQYRGQPLGARLSVAARNGGDGLMDCIFSIINSGPEFEVLPLLLSVVYALIDKFKPPILSLMRLLERWVSDFRPLPTMDEFASRPLLLLERCDCYFLTSSLFCLDILCSSALKWGKGDIQITPDWIHSVLHTEIQTISARVVEFLTIVNVTDDLLFQYTKSRLFPRAPLRRLEECFVGILDRNLSGSFSAPSMDVYSPQFFSITSRDHDSIALLTDLRFYELREASVYFSLQCDLKMQESVLAVLMAEIDHVPPTTCQERLIQACIKFFWLYINTGHAVSDDQELSICAIKLVVSRAFGIVATTQASDLIRHALSDPKAIDELTAIMGSHAFGSMSSLAASSSISSNPPIL